MNYLKLLLLSMFAIALSACATTSSSPSDDAAQASALSDASKVEWTDQALSIPDTTFELTARDELIQPLDVVDVSVFDVDKIGGEFQVNLDGKFKMPLVGEVTAEGLTPFELAAYIERRLGEEYLQNPQVNVRVKESEGEKVTVDGSVKRPGQYSIRGKTTLLQAIALSGGASENSNLGRVVVFRQVSGVRKAAAFDVKKIREGKSEDPEIYGNDIVVVDGSDLKGGYREVLRSIPLLLLFGRL